MTTPEALRDAGMQEATDAADPRARVGIKDTDYEVDANGCWIWQLFKDPDGYGGVRSRGTWWYAHRFSWTCFRGPIPKGMEIDHLCFEPSCINPDHLRVVTPEVNARNHRAAHKTHCARGHEYTPENTRYCTRPDGRRYRRCATCNAERLRRRRREASGVAS